jgi:hypothetical protein
MYYWKGVSRGGAVTRRNWLFQNCPSAFVSENRFPSYIFFAPWRLCAKYSANPSPHALFNLQFEICNYHFAIQTLTPRPSFSIIARSPDNYLKPPIMAIYVESIVRRNAAAVAKKSFDSSPIPYPLSPLPYRCAAGTRGIGQKVNHPGALAGSSCKTGDSSPLASAGCQSAALMCVHES